MRPATFTSHLRETDNLETMLTPVQQGIEGIEPGDNLLMEYGNTATLLKFENARVGPMDPLMIRVNRNVNVYCAGNIFLNRPDDPYTHRNPAQRIKDMARVEILGSHKVSLQYDDELGIHLSRSENHSDVYLNLAKRYADGHVEKCFEAIEVTHGDRFIEDRLRSMTRPGFFETNIRPFLEGRPTGLEAPAYRTRNNIITGLPRRVMKDNNDTKPHFDSFERSEGFRWFERVCEHTEEDQPVYIGSKEEVYIVPAGNPDRIDGLGKVPEKQTKILWFSNNYIGGYNPREENMVRGDFCPPSLGKEPFVFTAIGRYQSPKNCVFNGEPEIITADMGQAMAHFKETDFSEFKDTVQTYINSQRTQTPILYMGASPQTR